MPVKNPAQILEEAQQIIADRKATRKNMAFDVGSMVAMQDISDELTLIRAELSVIRSQFGNYAAMQQVRR
jgi:hypothetical protein